MWWAPACACFCSMIVCVCLCVCVAFGRWEEYRAHPRTSRHVTSRPVRTQCTRWSGRAGVLHWLRECKWFGTGKTVAFLQRPQQQSRCLYRNSRMSRNTHLTIGYSNVCSFQLKTEHKNRPFYWFRADPKQIVHSIPNPSQLFAFSCSAGPFVMPRHDDSISPNGILSLARKTNSEQKFDLHRASAHTRECVFCVWVARISFATRAPERQCSITMYISIMYIYGIYTE